MSDKPGSKLFNQYYDFDNKQGNRVKEIIVPPSRQYAPKEVGTANTAYMANTANTANTAVKATIPVNGPVARDLTVNKVKPAAEPKDEEFKLEFTSNSMMNGIILSELLGKPKILQKRRW